MTKKVKVDKETGEFYIEFTKKEIKELGFKRYDKFKVTEEGGALVYRKYDNIRGRK